MRTLNECLARSTERFPGRIALTDGATVLTYAELTAAVRRKACGLVLRGVRPGARVGIALDRGIDQVLAILAVLQCGAAYVPLDPSYPAERIDHIVRDAETADVITASGWAELTGECSLPEVNGADAAYVLYTSGSTGLPKGCVVTHHNVVSLLRCALPLFDFTEHDRWALCHSINFDVSVWEMWAAFTTGAALHVVPAEVAVAPPLLAGFLSEARVSVLNLVPSVFRLMVDAMTGSGPATSLRYVLFGGEPVDLRSVRAFRDRGAPDAVQYVNLYGITEATVHVTHRTLSADDLTGSSPHTPIGKPLPHMAISVRDEHGAEVATGEIGEMYVSGDGIASGYWKRPELTAERFVTIDGVRHYRSGDLARTDESGDLFYVGRNDHQFKVRGFRVEAGEVEWALGAVDGIAGAAVSVERDAFGEHRLVAWCLPADRQPDVRQVRAQLLRALPAHMVPERIVFVDRLPLSPSGKLDRTRLNELAR
ncbi:amino acid adenylation domain-containing protein [Lentzea alba]|uniref:amino acid adenylation domain-containing protein n=1 Tax=Lentzea alba TaxID=2714351 RepID=UPI0039BFC193